MWNESPVTKTNLIHSAVFDGALTYDGQTGPWYIYLVSMASHNKNEHKANDTILLKSRDSVLIKGLEPVARYDIESVKPDL